MSNVNGSERENQGMNPLGGLLALLLTQIHHRTRASYSLQGHLSLSCQQLLRILRNSFWQVQKIFRVTASGEKHFPSDSEIPKAVESES